MAMSPSRPPPNRTAFLRTGQMSNFTPCASGNWVE